MRKFDKYIIICLIIRHYGDVVNIGDEKMKLRAVLKSNLLKCFMLQGFGTGLHMNANK